MSRAARAYARIVVLAWAGSFSAGQLAVVTGLPGILACLLGGLLGMVAACVPWRQVAWLRLQVAVLRLSGGPGLVYLKADYGGREPKPVAAPPAIRGELRHPVVRHAERGQRCDHCEDQLRAALGLSAEPPEGCWIEVPWWPGKRLAHVPPSPLGTPLAALFRDADGD